jgi:hypothetical protein
MHEVLLILNVLGILMTVAGALMKVASHSEKKWDS